MGKIFFFNFIFQYEIGVKHKGSDSFFAVFGIFSLSHLKIKLWEKQFYQ